jgi:hypothetical protein
MYGYIIIMAISYGIYNNTELLSDMYFYFQMKQEEYMGIYTHDDIYEEEPAIIFTKESSDSENEDAYADILEISLLSIITNDFSNDFKQRCIRNYLKLLEIYSSMEIHWNHLKNDSIIVYGIDQFFSFLIRKYKRLVCTHLLEPDSDIWINNVSFYKSKNIDGIISYGIEENYSYIQNCSTSNYELIIESIKSRIHNYLESNQSKKALFKEIEKKSSSNIYDIMEYFVVSKWIDVDNTSKYIVTINHKLPEKLTYSKAKFLNIEYSHPSMETSVQIELRPEMMVVGSELLSPGFILYTLMHQSHPYVFDMDYTINVVDGMANICKLTSNKHIELTEYGYRFV